MHTRVHTPFTIFPSIYHRYASEADNLGWQDVVALLRQSSLVPRESKTEAVLFNGISYSNGRRKHEFAVDAGMMILDIDDGLSLTNAIGTVDDLGIESVVYTSASHNPPLTEKFRVVIPLAEKIPARLSRRIWDSLNVLFGSSLDKSKRGEHSIFYVPGDYAGVSNQFHYLPGRILTAQDWMQTIPTPDPDAAKHALRAQARQRTRQPAQMSMLEQMRRRLQVRQPRSDVWPADALPTMAPLSANPFVTEQAIDLYLNRADGWYHGRFAFMMSVASVARLKGYDITPSELVESFNVLDSLDGGYYLSPKAQQQLVRDAQNALAMVSA